MSSGILQLPPQASDIASRADALFFALLAVTGAVALAIFAVIAAFAWRYRRGAKARREQPPTGWLPVEIAWTATPLAIFLGIFAWGATLYGSLYDDAGGAMPVYVVGKQWMWKLQHANGKREVGELHLPLGQPVRLVLTTEDVIHSFYVPAFRIKQDAVPGRYTAVSFTPTELGSFALRCAEYCGTQHSGMLGTVVVMHPADFERWLSQGVDGGTMAARGFELFRRFGCSGCHSPRSTVHAPELTGIYGRTVHLADGRSVVAGDAYLRDSILLPDRDVVAGFESRMPSFQGQVSEEQILDLLAYLKSARHIP